MTGPDRTYARAAEEIAGVLARDGAAALTHILDVRAGLEAAAARLAAEHATVGDLRRLAAAFRARVAAHDAGDLPGYVAADAEFHRAVVEASGNPLLIGLYGAVAEAATASILQTAAIPENPRTEGAHSVLAAAVLDRNPDAAVQAAYALIDAVKATLTP